MSLYVLTLDDRVNESLTDSPSRSYRSTPQQLGALRVLATALVGTAATCLPNAAASVAIAGGRRTVHIHPASHKAGS